MKGDYLSLKYIKAEEEDKTGVLVKEIIRIETGQTIGQVVEIEDSSEIGPDLSRTTEGILFEIMLGDIEDKTAEGNIEMIVVDMMDTVEVGIDQERDHSQEFIAVIRARSASSCRSMSGSKASTNRDWIRCYNCRENDHSARDCPTSREERDLDQFQQMLNFEEEEQTHLLSNRQNSPMENSRTCPLSLWVVGMAPPHSHLLTPK